MQLKMEVSRLKAKVEQLVKTEGEVLHQEDATDMLQIMEEEDATVKEQHGEASFQRVFWDQQREAAKRSGHGMRWHPIMIR